MNMRVASNDCEGSPRHRARQYKYHIHRIEILACHGLKVENFSCADDAYKAADIYVQTQRASPLFAHIADQHPDQIFGVPQMDIFYYATHLGNSICIAHVCMSM